MNDFDLALRRLTYRLFVELGRAPTGAEIATAGGWRESDVLDGWRRLHDAHALVLETGFAAIRMANPFSAVPTPYRVFAGERWWYANCAWDAFGICAALDSNGRIESACPDCGESLTVEVREKAPDRADLLFHCLVPARDWWTNIGFT